LFKVEHPSEEGLGLFEIGLRTIQCAEVFRSLRAFNELQDDQGDRDEDYLYGTQVEGVLRGF
jgi:hypothetical protein